MTSIIADQAFTWPPHIYDSGSFSGNISPAKMAYRGVLIERPCIACDTVDVHFEGKCNSGLCQRRFGDIGDTCAQCAKLTYNHWTEEQPDSHNKHSFIPMKCGAPRFGSRPEMNHDRQYIHRWVAPTYYPADIEFDLRGDTDFKMLAAKKAFDAILDKVKEIGQPEFHTSDLFRDYQRLAGVGPTWKGIPGPQRFVWAVRKYGCGTDIFTPEVGISGYYTANPHAAYFLYDGTTHGPLGDFLECDLATARTILAVWRGLDLAPVYTLGIGSGATHVKVDTDAALGPKASIGMRVRYIPSDAVEAQANWGNNQDPRERLDPGSEYEIERVEIHSWHTKIWLKDAGGPFNSVSFVALS